MRKNILFIVLMSAMIYVLSPTYYASSEMPRDNTPCKSVNMKTVTVPEDFSITYITGPLHAGWGRKTVLTVTANGEVTQKEFSGSRGLPPKEKITKYFIKKEQIKKIYAQVIACDFFSLDKKYWNQHIRDGGSQYLEVISDGKTHDVTTYYYNVKRFSSIVHVFEQEIKHDDSGK
jgi:hypothetical protein